MKAAVLYGAGDVRFEDVADPKAGPGEIVIKTLAAMTCGTDLKVVRRGYHAKMLRPPCVFGHEAAGEVVEVGEGVVLFKRGDAVVAANSAPCGVCLQCARGRESLCDDLCFWNGCFADAYVVPARVVAKNVLRLDGVTPQDAAMTEPLACCVKGVEDASVRERDRVLVIGAGSIALMLLRLCALKGARVTVAARREASLGVATQQGADETVLLSKSDGGLTLASTGSTSSFDAVFDAGGAPETASLAIRSTARGGTASLFAGCPAATMVNVDITRVHYDEIRILGSFHHTPASFRESFRLIATKAIEPGLFITHRGSLPDLPQHLMNPAPGTLKTLVVF